MFDKYAQYYDIINSDKNYKKDIDFVYTWAGKPKSVLDIGCGTASYWKYYPKQLIINGVEKSLPMMYGCRNVVCADITTKRIGGEYECATALFDAMNYIPKHDWWKNLPIRKGGSFIFDIWDDKKVWTDGFKKTKKEVNGVTREITPIRFTGKYVDLKISVTYGEQSCVEEHRLYIYSEEDIEKFCGKEFELVSTRTTDTWQKYYKLVKR